jgi:hypothetical protein
MCAYVVCILSPLSTFGPLNQSLWNLVRISQHLAHRSVCPSVFPQALLGNGSVNKFPLQQIYATIEELLETSFYYAITVVQKETRPLVLPRTSGIPAQNLVAPYRKLWRDTTFVSRFWISVSELICGSVFIYSSLPYLTLYSSPRIIRMIKSMRM